ncbi:hypothetical protein RA265_28840, partial [Pseudomonas syringae pv. tagetis]
ILHLKRDAQELLKLAQGIGRVKDAVRKILTTRKAQQAAPKAVAKAPGAEKAKTPENKAAKTHVKVAADKQVDKNAYKPDTTKD